jgi:UDP-glucose 4-epimerase
VKRRVAVTGSQGFVGRHLRHALAVRDVEVVGIDLPGTRAEIELDLSAPDFDAAALAERCGAVTGVIYMAATITRGSSVDAAARANLRAIAEAATSVFEAFSARAGSPHFVYCSTYKTYGPQHHLIDPQIPPQRPDPHSYGSAKSLAERLLTIAAARTGGSFAVVRPTCIYGPGQHLHNAIPRFLRAAWAGDAPVVYGTGRDVRDDVLAPDLAYCLVEACFRRATGAFHATGDRSRTILQTAEACCQAVALLGGPGGLRPVVDASKPPKWWLDQTFDWTRSRDVLGYEPTPFVEGLSCEAAWIADGSRATDTVRFCPPPRIGGVP